MTRTSLVLFALLAAALPAHAQVYKCVDGGRTIYSQTPCPASSQSTTITRTAPAAPAPGEAKSGAPKAGAPKTAAEQEQAYRKRQQEEQKAQKKADDKLTDAKAKEQRCNIARNELLQLEQGGRIARMNDKGEPYLLDDGQIEQERARARGVVDQWCK